MQIPEALTGIGMGWHGLAAELHDKLRGIDPEYDLDGLHEKFGLMRVYAGGRPAIHVIVDDYEERSGHQCRRCGHTAVTTHEWMTISTLCNVCREHPRRNIDPRASQGISYAGNTPPAGRSRH